MFFNIIIFFIILLILGLILKHSIGAKEGFFDLPASHNSFVEDSRAKFNELTNTINLTNPTLPVSPDSANAFKIALGGLIPQPTSGTFDFKSKTDYNIPNNSPSTFQQAKKCQDAGSTCAAFDDPNFAANCGMSFDINAIGADGKPAIGGLFISPDDRQKQMDAAANVLSSGGPPYDPYKVYQPTLGKSKPGTFALTKDQCVVVKEKVDCASKQTFNSPNCTQCYTTQNFARVGPDTPRIPSTLFLFGSGNVTVSSSNNKISLGQTALDQQNATQLNIPADAEGTNFTINVQPTGNSPLAFVAGFIQGQTPRGTFKLDLMSLTQSDLVTNAKPHINGSITVNGFRCLTLVPGNKQTTMNLSCLVPFSFLSMYDGDALTCDNGPIITQAASATFLESDPCFGKANQPGNYKLECLQTRWIELGGTPQGTGYPSNQAAADAIQKDANGQALDIDTIVDNLAPKMVSALSGKNASGQDLSIPDWNTVSMWGTGVPINTPCDGPGGDTGPLTQECLSYLYMNQGVTSHIGPTYTLSSQSMASMKGQDTPNTYCQPGTSIDPATPAGLKFGQSLGGINAVKQTYDQINRLANDNTLTNSARATAVQQCYGVSLDAKATGKTTGSQQVFAVGPGYNYTKDQAQGICAQYGAQVATSAQLQDAQSYGADWCFTGWVSDSSNAMYPITTSTQGGCGNGTTGIMNYTPPGNVAGVNCYGPKPGIDNYPTGTILPFSQTLWNQPDSKPVGTGPPGIFTVLAGDVGNGNYNVWYTDKNLTQPNMTWTQIPGGLITISLAPQGFVFGTSYSNNIWYLAKYNDTSGTWTEVPGMLRQIHTDGTIVCGTNAGNYAYAARISDALAGQWIQLPSVLTKIVTYNGQYYCVGLDNHIYYLTNPATPWVMTLTSGLFKDIAIDETGIIVLLGMDNNFYYSDSGQFTPQQQYTAMAAPSGTTWKSMSISKGSIYAIDVGGQPWYTSNYKSPNWVKVPGGNEFAPSHRMTSV